MCRFGQVAWCSWQDRKLVELERVVWIFAIKVTVWFHCVEWGKGVDTLELRNIARIELVILHKAFTSVHHLKIKDSGEAL